MFPALHMRSIISDADIESQSIEEGPLANEAYFKDILGEKGHRYKRVVLALCLVIIALSVIPDVDYSKLSFFGLAPAANDAHGKLIVFGTLWLLLLYHAAFLAWHAHQDWRDWLHALLPDQSDTHAFPRLNMYFGRPPDKKLTDRRLGTDATDVSWEFARRHQWVLHYTPVKVRSKNEIVEIGQRKQSVPFQLPQRVAESVRARVWMFLAADCGLPLLLIIAAIAASCYSWR